MLQSPQMAVAAVLLPLAQWQWRGVGAMALRMLAGWWGCCVVVVPTGVLDLELGLGLGLGLALPVRLQALIPAPKARLLHHATAMRPTLRPVRSVPQ